MKRTLLEMTQEILSAMESDEVNSITDTVESNSVALLIKGVYYDICTEMNLYSNNSLFELNASGDADQPTLMTIPSNVMNVDWVEYNVEVTGDSYPDWQRINFLPLDEFLAQQNSLRNESADVGEMEFTLHGETFHTMFHTDRRPYCYTCVDDYTLLFDSYDSDEDTTLQKSKTRCQGTMIPVFTMSDNFIPAFNAQQFSYFYNKAKTRAFAELKQAPNQESAGEARNQKIILQKRKRTSEDIPEVLKVGARYGRHAPMQAPYTIPNYLRQGD